MLLLQVGLAAWVVWSVLKHDAPRLLTVLPVAFFGCFVGGYGWYFLLAGQGGEPTAVGNLLCLPPRCWWPAPGSRRRSALDSSTPGPNAFR